jgi:hypothetical protein
VLNPSRDGGLTDSTTLNTLVALKLEKVEAGGREKRKQRGGKWCIYHYLGMQRAQKSSSSIRNIIKSVSACNCRSLRTAPKMTKLCSKIVLLASFTSKTKKVP